MIKFYITLYKTKFQFIVVNDGLKHLIIAFLCFNDVGTKSKFISE